MLMVKVELDADEWQRVMGIIAQAPWNVANPLLMKIGDQVQRQTANPAHARPDGLGRPIAEGAKPQ